MTNSCESCKFYFPIHWEIVELKEGHRSAVFPIQGSERTQLIPIKTLIPYASHINTPLNWCSYFGQKSQMIVQTKGECSKKAFLKVGE